MKKTIFIIIAVAALLLTVFYFACVKKDEKVLKSLPEETAKDGTVSAAEENGKDPEPSDLDRDEESLFADECEHNIKTYTCDECRYETGVVHITPQLFKDGLLTAKVIKNEDHILNIRFSGEIQLDSTRSVTVAAPMAGRIAKIDVLLGRNVSQGSTLFQLDCPGLAEAEGDYLTARSTAETSEIHYNRQKELREANVNSEHEYLEAKKDYENGKTALRTAEARLINLGLSKEEIAAIGSEAGRPGGRLTVKSPIRGEVIKIEIGNGQIVDFGTPAVLIGDSSLLWLWARLDETQLQIVREAGKGPVKVKAYVSSLKNEEFDGSIDFVEPLLSSDTRTSRARIVLANRSGRLIPGMYAQAELNVVRKNVTAVPQEAVMSDEGRSFIFVFNRDGYYIRRPVTVIGKLGDDLLEIESKGLLGRKVIVRGAFLLKSDVLRSKMGAGCAD